MCINLRACKFFYFKFILCQYNKLKIMEAKPISNPKSIKYEEAGKI